MGAKWSMDALLMTGTAGLTAQLLSMTLQETNEHCTMSARQQTFITKSLGIALALHGTHPGLSQPERGHFVLGRKRFECFPSLFPAFTISILIHFLNHSFLVLVHSGQC